MQAKLLGYIQPERVAWTYDDKDQSLEANYARAVADYRENRIDKALSGINSLIAQEPNNPYFYELKGQMLVDFGRVQQAIIPLQRASSILPNDGLMRTALGHAQIEVSKDDINILNKAIENLKIATRAEPRSTHVHRLLATAYGRRSGGTEDGAYARYHLAEEALLQNKIPYAKQQAKIALANLPKGSPAAVRANDILLYRENK